MPRLTPITYRIRPATNEDAAAVRAIVLLTLIEFELPALLESTDADLYDLEASYFQTGGTFEVVEGPDGKIVGCAGLYLPGNGLAELRKLYLRPDVRQVGLWDLLLRRMARKARDLGCTEIRLETNRALRDVQRLCEGHGFRAAEPAHPSARCERVYRFCFPEGPESRHRPPELPDTWTVWPRSKEAGVPRQFGIGTAIMMMTMFAVLFAVLRSANVPPTVFAYTALFFLGVGAGQALLYHGLRPRRASIVMGIVMTFALGLFDALVMDNSSKLIEVAFSPCCPGAIFGYVAGLLIASVFLICDKLTDAYRRRFPPKDEEP